MGQHASRTAGVAAILLVAVIVGACGESDIINGPTDRPVTATPTTLETEPPDTPPTITDFRPISLKGRGNKVVKFKIPESAAAIATITHKGSSNFAVWTVASDGSTNALLVNEIGKYSGTRLFDTDAHSVAFKIEADGSWTVTVKPVTSAKVWSGAKSLKGRGDDVLLLKPATTGLTVATITHRGESNFAVIAYGPDGSDLLVNEIGKYSGESLLAEGTFLLEVTADGTWTIALSE